MRYRLVFLFFIGCFCLNSQALPKAYIFFQNGEYEQAVPEFRKLIPEIIDTWGENDTLNVMPSYALLAGCYEVLGNLDSCIYYNAKALKIGLYYGQYCKEDFAHIVYSYIEGINLKDEYVDIFEDFEKILQKDFSKIRPDITNLIIEKLKVFESKYHGNINSNQKNLLELLYHKLSSIDKSFAINELKIKQKTILDDLSINYDDLFKVYVDIYLAYKGINELDSVFVYLDKSVELFSKSFLNDKESFLDIIIPYAELCYKKNKPIVGFEALQLLNENQVFNNLSESEINGILNLNYILLLKMIKTNNDLPQKINSVNNAIKKLKATDFQQKTLILNYYMILSALHFINNDIVSFENVYKLSIKSISEESIQSKRTINYLMNLINVIENRADWGRIEKLINEFKNTISAKNLINYEDVLRLDIRLSSIYRAKLDYESAEKILGNILVQYRINFQKDGTLYCEVLATLAEIYIDKNLNAKADSLFKICSRICGKDDINYLSSLTKFKMTIGQDIPSRYLEVLSSLYNKSIADTILIECKHNANKLNNLGLLYMKNNEYYKSNQILMQSFEIQSGDCIKHNLTYLTTLNNLGILHYHTGDYKKAEYYLNEGIDFLMKNSIRNSEVEVLIKGNMAGIYRISKKYFEAEELFKETILLAKKLNNDNIDILPLLINLGTMYDAVFEYQKAEKVFDQCFINMMTNINNNFPFLSENSRCQFINSIFFSFNILRSFYLNNNQNKEGSSRKLFATELLLKQMVMDYGLQIKKFVNSSSDKDLQLKYKELTEIKSMNNSVNLGNADIERLDKLESEISKFVIQESGIDVKSPDIKLIKSQLKNNQVAIEFSSFQYRTHQSWTDSILYVALIIRQNDSIPQIIKLCEQKQLNSIIFRTTYRESEYVNNIYKNKRLYELIWKPIERFLKLGNQIYFSPSGSLHQISLGATAISDSTYLSDQYTFHQVGSTGVLASEDRSDKIVKDVAIFGGIDFDASDEQIASAAKDVVLGDDIVSRSLYTQDSTRSGKWTYLNGTLDEAQSIDKMAKSKNIQSQLFTGSQAIEERFKSLSGKKSPSVIHIATHGFFFPDPKVDKKKLDMMSFQSDNTFTLADNPMNRSGLLFAGGNKAWIGEEPTTDREDGILTAYEVSNMSLFNTELVVLSACETGLGDIKGSEGVYGLQRAFKQAGVRYLMMSLWKVPDNATKEFMTTFYTEYLTNQKPVREAFNITQSKMKDKYRNEPYKWGGFVLME